MASSILTNDSSSSNAEYMETNRKFEENISTLPKEDELIANLVKYKGTWLIPDALKGFMLAEDHFLALPSDIFLATFPKCGTTWLKALTFTILNRPFHDPHPLMTKNPHECYPFLEFLFVQDPHTSFSSSSPRVFSTHIPCRLLPKSIESSACRIVYMARDPRDMFVSYWYHLQKRMRLNGIPAELTNLQERFDMFCRGVFCCGPYWDHALSYSDAAASYPEKVLILTYEDMKKNPFHSVKKLARFLGHPFSEEEEKDGIVEKTVEFCSFENLSNFEVNKTGVQKMTSSLLAENNMFFRKGVVGDWKTHLTEEMVERINQITKQKFEGTAFMSYISP